MNRINHQSILIILSFFVLQVTAQNGSVFERAAQLMYAWHSIAPTEKLYVHQDRTHYVAGETVWFKIYQSFSKEIDQGSGVAYVDLIDGSNSYVAQTKWKLENGRAAGHFRLPDSLPTGSYQLRAYTRWMQNFDAKGFFTREITVSSTSFAGQPAPLTQGNRLTLFPEGGYMVAGLLSRMAFEVTDANGKGMDAKGFITDKEGNMIQPFETEYNGMGSINFVPEKGKTYIATLNGSEVAVPFPEIQPQGVVMTTHVFRDQFRVTLRHNMNNRKSLNLTIHQDGIPYFNGSLDLNRETVVADIPVSKLPAGIFTVTAYDETCHAWCERLFLVRYPEPLNLIVSIDQDAYRRRDKVTLKIEATDADGNPQSGDFSLSVVKANLDNPLDRNNFYTDYYLQSELRGRIDNPAFYLEPANYKALDLLLMTHGWRRYAWNDMAMGNQPSLYFSVEKGLSFSGSVTLRNRRQNPKDVQLTAVFLHDSINEVVSTNPGEGGIFRFENYDFTDTSEVILSAKDNRQTLDLSVITHPYPQPSYYAYESIATQEENDYLLIEIFGEMPEMTGDMENTIYDLPEVIVTANRRMPRDSRAMHNSTFAQYIYEVKKDFSYGGRGAWGILALMSNNLALNIYNELADYRAFAGNDDNLFILDGRYVSKGELQTIPVSIIERVEVLEPSTAMLYGGRRIFFFTRSWDERIRDIRGTTSYKFAGYNQPKEFYSPDYSLPLEKFNPDFRNTLYWLPSIQLDERGKGEFNFFTSDQISEYLIICEGRGNNGMIGVLSNLMKVQ